MTNKCLSALAVSAILLPSTALADVWDEFLRDCFEPISAGVLAPPADMEQRGAYKNDGDTYSTYRVSNGSATLSVSDGRADQPYWCRIVADGKAQDAALANRFLTWSSQPQIAERFEEVEMDEPVLTLQSVDGRNPVLQVSMNLEAQNTGVVFMAKELN